MTMFFALIGAIAVAGIVGSTALVSRDGYRRQPTRPLAVTYRHSTEPPALAEPAGSPGSGIGASQRLSDSAASGPATAHGAGAMALRPR